MVRPLRFLAPFLAALSLPLAAGADCPSDATGDGIYTTFTDLVVQHQVRPDGTILETETSLSDGTVWQYVVHPTGLLLESWELSAGLRVADSMETVTYSVAPPQIAPNIQWSATETARFPDGSEIRYATEMEILSPVELAVEDCTYIGWPVNVRRRDLDVEDAWVEAQMYLPELKVVVYLGDADLGQRPAIEPPETISATRPAILN